MPVVKVVFVEPRSVGLTLDLPIPVTHIDQFRESRVFTRPARRGPDGKWVGPFSRTRSTRG